VDFLGLRPKLMELDLSGGFEAGVSALNEVPDEVVRRRHPGQTGIVPRLCEKKHELPVRTVDTPENHN
jgi:hypothetical protein